VWSWRADTAIAEAAALRPDLLILDYCLPGPPTAEVVRRVGERSPETRILVYTGYPCAACLREFRGLGVAGYLLKTEPPETVLLVIGLVARGGTWFPESVERPAPDGFPCPALTERDREVLRLLVGGETDEQIAAEVNLTGRAVRYTLRVLYDKLGVDTRVQAAVRAVRLGLTDEG
jgi:DNA-binding NarL/FixJ family response regulator